jgi:hypothetical protein
MTLPADRGPAWAVGLLPYPLLSPLRYLVSEPATHDEAPP